MMFVQPSSAEEFPERDASLRSEIESAIVEIFHFCWHDRLTGNISIANIKRQSNRSWACGSMALRAYALLFIFSRLMSALMPHSANGFQLAKEDLWEDGGKLLCDSIILAMNAWHWVASKGVCVCVCVWERERTLPDSLLDKTWNPSIVR